jgi:hypothetical protein
MSYAFKHPSHHRTTNRRPTAITDSVRKKDVASTLNRDRGLSSRTTPITDSVRPSYRHSTASSNSGFPAMSRNSALPATPRQVAALPKMPNVTRLPNATKTPFWLRSLLKLHQGSMIVTFVLISSALTLYGWTVYSQQLWSQQYEKLMTLQRTERGMTAYGEVMKNNLAQQAQHAESNLVAQSPSNTIFLQPAPQRPAKTAATNTSQQESEPKTPLGY